MKRYFVSLAVALLLLTALPACKKIYDKVFPGFDFTIKDIGLTIPIIPLSNLSGSVSQTIHFNLDSTIRATTNGTFGINAITFIKVKSLDMILQNGDLVNNMANFKSVSIGISGNSNTTPTLIATANIPDSVSNSLRMDVNNSPDILPYLKNNELVLDVMVTTRRATTHPLQALANLTVTIK